MYWIRVKKKSKKILISSGVQEKGKFKHRGLVAALGTIFHVSCSCNWSVMCGR